MNYEDMSDFEINKLVAQAMGGFGGSTNDKHHPNEVICYDEHPFCTHRDYCGNPADAWPIITSSNINITTGGDEWCAWHWSDGFESWHKNPLRAATIVYLMMQEVE